MTDDIIAFDQDDELDLLTTPTPLSDPVFTAIFQNVDVSGLAMKSLLNATLEDSGDTPVGEVISVTPQSVHSETSMRGYRIDVEAKTTTGEIALVEVQLKLFASTMERTLLYAEQALASFARRGDTLEDVTSSMPRVIAVNILEHELRKEGGFHQIAELLYREPPYERATDRLQVHNLELSKYRKLQMQTPAKPLHCWLTAICRAQDTKKPLAEVVKMDEVLQAYSDHDEGFAQFVERHGFVAATSEVRKAYRRWEYDQIIDRLEAERQAAKRAAEIAEGHAEGLAQGIEQGLEQGLEQGIEQGIEQGLEQGIEQGINEGIQKARLEVALTMKAEGMQNSEIARLTKLPETEIEKL